MLKKQNSMTDGFQTENHSTVHTQCGIEKGFIQKARQKVVVAFFGKMTAHYDCVADGLIQAGRASIIQKHLS